MAKRKTNGDGRFYVFGHYMWQCEAWRSLPAVERCAYFEVAMRFNGSNNGRIGLSIRDLATALRIGKTRAAEALAILQARGFIEAAKPAKFSTGGCKACEWRITEKPCDVTGEMPTRTFQNWRPTVPDSGRKNQNVVRSQTICVPESGQGVPDSGHLT